LIEVLVSLKHSRSQRYPKEETAALENLLSKALDEDVISYNNNAVILGQEPGAVRIDGKEADLKRTYEETPYVTETILGVSVNQSTKIDALESGNSVIEKFAYNAPASDNINIGEAKTVKPWGTLVEGDEERPLFITIEEHRESDEAKLEVDKDITSVEVEELRDSEIELDKTVPKHVRAVTEGKGSVRAVDYSDPAFDYGTAYPSTTHHKIVITEDNDLDGEDEKANDTSDTFVSESNDVSNGKRIYELTDKSNEYKETLASLVHNTDTASDDEAILLIDKMTSRDIDCAKQLCQIDGDIPEEAIAKYTEAVNEANTALKNELRSLNDKK
jgi:hypothetical protein